MQGNDSSIPASEIKPVAHWESAHLYDHDLPAEHSLDLEWVISAQGEQPVAADGTHLPLDGNRYYGSHVALEVSEMKMTDVDGNYDVLRTVSSSFISPERALDNVQAAYQTAIGLARLELSGVNPDPALAMQRLNRGVEESDALNRAYRATSEQETP